MGAPGRSWAEERALELAARKWPRSEGGRRGAIERVIRETISECARVCDGLRSDSTSEFDNAYHLALDHAQRRIRALAAPQEETGDGE